MTLPPAVATLITARRIEQVPADRASALLRLTRAEAKLDAAREIAAIDVEVAYVTGYDAARIAVTAHMLAAGYRMRRRRSKAQYDDIVIGRADLTADLAHAEAIIKAVRKGALTIARRARFERLTAAR